MMGRTWTQSQMNVLSHRGGEAIVSASAGSGKTSVLIERIIRMVRDEHVPIEQFLVVTFTDDAAAQLKDRLRSELEKACEAATSSDERLRLMTQRQAMDRASIQTIHAFSRQVLREQHHLLEFADVGVAGPGPDFAMLDASESDLMQQRLLEELLEACYALPEDDAFRAAFVDLAAYYGGSEDDELRSAVMTLNALWSTIEDPEAWQANVREMYASLTPEGIAEHRFWKSLRTLWPMMLESMTAEMQRLQCDATTTIAEDVQCFQQDAGQVETLRQLIDRNDVERVRTFSLDWGKWRPKSAKKDSPELIEARDALLKRRNAIKDECKKILWIMQDAADPERLAAIRGQWPRVETLLRMAQRFHESYQRAKAEHGAMDFDDLQRYATAVLKRRVDDRDDSGTVADMYRERFAFVMVDEYQDVNELQDAIVRSVCRRDAAGRCANLLVVGDVKQSIYRFRLAEPTIFQNLCRLGDEATSGVRRIDLQENFRSRNAVIETVNFLFRQLLPGGVLEVDYSGPAALVVGADFSQQPDQSCHRTELVLINTMTENDIPNEDGTTESISTPASRNLQDDDSTILDLENTDREAFAVAKRVRELIDSQMLIRSESGFRPIQAGDVTILLKKMKGVASRFVLMLRRHQLDAACNSSEGFLEFPEISDVWALLQLIDNPCCDIPLAAVLRSPAFSFSADDLVTIRRAQERGPLYRAVLACAASMETESLLAMRLQRFVQTLNDLRARAATSTLVELIHSIDRSTRLTDLHASMSPTGRAAEHLEQFVRIASQFDRHGEAALRDFLDFLDRVSEANEKLPKSAAAGGMGVRLMTVHGSKGLEFPVVVCPMLAAKRVLRDLGRRILIDRHLGISLAQDASDRSAAPTLDREAIRHCAKSQLLAEELRLLYVAATRAKEKLIFTATDRSDKLAEFVQQVQSAERPSASKIVACSSTLRWLMLAMASETADATLANVLATDVVDTATAAIGPIDVTVVGEDDQIGWEMSSLDRPDHLSAIGETFAKAIVGEHVLTQADDSQARDMITRMHQQYRFASATKWPAKFSVTALTQRAAADAEIDADVLGATIGVSDPSHDAFDDFEAMTMDDNEAIIRGWVFHKVMETLPLTSSITSAMITSHIETLVRDKRLTAEHARLVDAKTIDAFFATEPGRLMQEHATRVYREQPFTHLVRPSDLPAIVPQSQLSDANDQVMIQGVIDCLIDTGDGWVIVDYKTSRIGADGVDRKRDHYQPQIDLYARAMSQILQRRVASAWLYFTEPNVAVRMI